MHKSKRKWNCVDCSNDTKLEHFFVKNTVWFGEAKMPEMGMLCVGCLERRIGRTLCKNDFTDAHINDPRRYSKTARLVERLTAVESRPLVIGLF